MDGFVIENPVKFIDLDVPPILGNLKVYVLPIECTYKLIYIYAYIYIHI